MKITFNGIEFPQAVNTRIGGTLTSVARALLLVKVTRGTDDSETNEHDPSPDRKRLAGGDL